jgi:vancomycin resistance protein VanW
MLTALRKALRNWVPLPLRRGVARLHRAGRDRLDGSHRRLARTVAPPYDLPAALQVEQAIRQSPLWEGKLANLQLGAAMLDGVKIAPGEVFSFWHWIGQPSTARGFAIGRAILADEATGDPGGGLCQLSGIIYELGLRGGLTVAERHAHSRDLYASEEERFTPLGLDRSAAGEPAGDAGGAATRGGRDGAAGVATGRAGTCAFFVGNGTRRPQRSPTRHSAACG